MAQKMQQFIITVIFWVMTLHCSLIGGFNILEEYSPWLNFTFSSVKMDEACSYKSLCTPERLCLRNNLIDINQIFVCNVNQMMWSEVDTWFTAQKLTLWEVFLHGFSPKRMRACTHTHIHTFLQPIQLCM